MRNSLRPVFTVNIEKPAKFAQQNGNFSKSDKIGKSNKTEIVTTALITRENKSEVLRRDGDMEEKEGQTETKKKPNGKSSHDSFTVPPAGGAGYSNFIRHFPMQATRHDPESHSISFSLPSMPLTRDRNGHPYIADLVFQVAPGFFYHVYCDDSLRDQGHSFWSLDTQRIAAGRACSNIVLKTVLEVDPAMYKTTTGVAGLAVDMRVRRGGKKHFYISQDFLTADRSHRLMQAMSIGLFFDTTNRSAIELPEDLVSSMPSLESKLVPYIWHVDQPAAPPPHAFRYSVQVVWGHVDFNGHMGFQWYAQHAIDAILLAVTSQETEAITTLTTSNMAAGVSSVSIDYLKECCYGDHLNLFAWQDSEHDKMAHCWIENQGEVYSKITFIF